MRRWTGRARGNFIRWANRQKLTRLEFAAARWGGPTGVIDTETRWQQARRLIHDDTIRPEDRVAGLLVLLYAQWPAAISRLTLDHVQTSAGEEELDRQRYGGGGAQGVCLSADPADVLHARG